MSLEQVKEWLEKHDDEYLHFSRVENKKSTRPDVNALILLAEHCDENLKKPSCVEMISASEHDIVYFDVNCDDIERLTEEQVIELRRCGFHFDADTDSLAMYT